jgi:hypothetical protein
MKARILRLLIAFALLLVLLALEVWMSFWPLSGPLRPLILVPALLMIAVLTSVFMEIRHAPTAAHLFVVASLLWLSILLGLGSLDPLTRTNHLVQNFQAN